MPTEKTFFQRELERVAMRRGLSGDQYLRIRRAKQFMDRAYSREIRLREIAAAAHLSRFHFIRIFRRVYGLSPGQYLRDLRINRARQLLLEGWPVTRVCGEVGYASLPTFSRVFKCATGHAPSAYAAAQYRNRG